MSGHIFISYARADGAEFAHKLHDDLVKLGVPVWLDAYQIPPGSDWDAEIDKGLDRAAIMVVLLTPGAVGSKQVKSEWNRALKKGLDIIPLLILDCEIPRVLETLQYIDFRKKKDYETGIDKLTTILKRQSGLWEGESSSAEITSDKPLSDITLTPEQEQFRRIYATDSSLTNYPGGVIRVVIVDDHDVVLRGLQTSLEEFDDIAVIGAFIDARRAVDLCRSDRIAVVLMDMIMPIMDGVTATRLIREVSPNTHIIAFTSFNDDDTIRKAFLAGVRSFVMKNASVDELANVVRRASVGQSTLWPEAAQLLFGATIIPTKLGYELTDREREVLVLMIEGLNNREIAERLILSSSTIKNHVSNILDKLGATSRTQAVALAVERKLID
jgi:NarL family two-component system response regulator LiaR